MSDQAIATGKSVQDRILDVIAHVMDERVAPDAKLDDLGDSLDQIEVRIAVEEAFLLDLIDDPEWIEAGTVSGLAALVERRIAAAPDAPADGDLSIPERA